MDILSSFESLEWSLRRLQTVLAYNQYSTARDVENMLQ